VLEDAGIPVVVVDGHGRALLDGCGRPLVEPAPAAGRRRDQARRGDGGGRPLIEFAPVGRNPCPKLPPPARRCRETPLTFCTPPDPPATPRA
jgi:hypothetical protein